jgi:hypothetical protein
MPGEHLPPDEPVSKDLQFGDVIRTFTPADTLVRMFGPGLERYDHCVFAAPDGRLIAFTPTREAIYDLIGLGFPMQYDEAIDEPTLEHYRRVQAAHLDDDPYDQPGI